MPIQRPKRGGPGPSQVFCETMAGGQWPAHQSALLQLMHGMRFASKHHECLIPLHVHGGGLKAGRGSARRFLHRISLALWAEDMCCNNIYLRNNNTYRNRDTNKMLPSSKRHQISHTVLLHLHHILKGPYGHPFGGPGLQQNIVYVPTSDCGHFFVLGCPHFGYIR